MEISDVTEGPRDGVFKWEDGRLVLYEYVPTLLEMSSFAVALDIWNSWVPCAPLDVTMKRTTNRCISVGSAMNEYIYESEKFVEKLAIPTLVAKMIQNDLDVINQAIFYVRYVFFPHVPTEELYRIFFVDSKKWMSWQWRFYVEIDIEKTVTNLMSDTELNVADRFIVMCRCCLANEIEKISLSSLPSDLINRMLFVDPLIFYWICRLRNELHKIPLDGFASIDAAMARKLRNNDIAFEYFWNRLSDDEQFLEIMSWFDNENPIGFKYMKKFLSKMTQHQQDHLFSRYLDLIVKYFWIDLRMPKFAFSIWMRVRDRCTVDQFTAIIKLVIGKYFDIDNDMSVLIDVWNTAPDYLRKNLNEVDMDTLFRTLYISDAWGCRFPVLNCFKIFQQIFWVKKENCWDTMIRIAAHVAPRYSNSPRMSDVLKLCWPHEDTRSQFNESVFNSKITLEHVVKMVEQQQFAEVAEMLTNYSLQENFIRNSMEWILIQSNLNRMTFMCCYASWLKLSEFIGKIFGDEISSSNIKKQFVSSFVAQFSNRWRGNQCLNELPKIVEPLMTPEDLRILKQTFLNDYEKVAKYFTFWCNFKEEYLHSFLSWCLEDDAEVDKFRKIFPIGDIFDQCLKKAKTAEKIDFRLVPDSNELLNILDKCLLWYFGSVDEAKQYKESKTRDLDYVERQIFRNFESKLGENI